MDTNFGSVTLSKLVLSPDNVRKSYSEESIDALARNIELRKFRILQNLVVSPIEGDKYQVNAGGRRFRALKLLQKRKKIDGKFLVPVMFGIAEDAVEDSLTENLLREAMHPVDEFLAFQELVQNGKSNEDIAARFGVTPGVVTRRLKLASVAPAILEAFRNDKLELQHVMAFTVSSDHAAQTKVFEQIAGLNYTPARNRIVQMLTAEQLSTDAPIFKFVGEDAYVAAG